MQGGNEILVSSSTYEDVGGVTSLVAGAQIPTNSGKAVAVSGGSGVNGNPLGVFFNDSPDANFGVTSPLTITQYSPAGVPNFVLNLPAASGLNTADGITTSFSSKSEGSLTIAPNGRSVTVMGYSAPVGTVDASNAQTPGGAEPGNTDMAAATYRVGATISPTAQVTYTQTNSYSGNNPRAGVAVGNTLLMVGNAGNGNGSNQISNGTGVQYTTLGTTVNSVGGVPTISNGTPITYGPGGSTVGTYSVVQNGLPADKTAKDSNFRGLTDYNNTIYVTKGSGSNGIDTVYQVGNAGGGVTLPATSAPTVANPLASNNPITVLPGLSTSPAKTAADFTPFSTWFANSTTMYVSDEGDGDAIDSIGTGETDTHGGIDKYSLVGNTWKLDYVLQGSLIGAMSNFANFGDVTTTGLRQINGVVNADGTVTIYGVTATQDNVTDGKATMDAGADPNEVVSITDVLGDTTLPAGEDYSVFAPAQLGMVYRGITVEAPEPASLLIFGSAVGGLVAVRRRRAGKARHTAEA